MIPNAFAPARLNGLALRNRVIKTATYEGMCPGGMPSDALVEHHRPLAARGVALTTVAYCAVSGDGRTFAEQMFMRHETVAPLRRVTDAVHREGGAASLQLSLVSRPAKRGSVRSASSQPRSTAGAPARNRLMPSGASSTVPLSGAASACAGTTGCLARRGRCRC